MGLSPISDDWDAVSYYSKTNFWYTRVTAYFDGNTILKVISETKGTRNYESYEEYDTNLATDERKLLLPITSRGKPKALSVSSISGIMPFGCSFKLVYELASYTTMSLYNPRAKKEFPIGEYDKIASIRSESDFHSFMKNYISTCGEDYFPRLKAFTASKRTTVRYKPGDIFRMELDRTHYCYGIITGDIKKIKAMSELPEKHSLRQLMMVPIMVRYYQLVTENPNLKGEELSHIPLGRVNITADNDIIWGTYPVVDHKQLSPDDLEFNFVCTKIISDSTLYTLFTHDMLLHDGLIPKQEYSLYIEWGFAQTSLRYDQLSEKLKEMLDGYSSPHGGVIMGIHPREAVVGNDTKQSHSYRNNLLNSENREMLNEIFACLGLDADTTFDQFAKAFGGLTKEQIASRL